jgi:hypothetical protein
VDKKKEEVHAKVRANFQSQRRQIEDQLDKGFQCVYEEAPMSNGQVYKDALQMVFESQRNLEAKHSGVASKINFYELKKHSVLSHEDK